MIKETDGDHFEEMQSLEQNLTREYSFRASTFISLYADRLEFTSIGDLVSVVSLIETSDNAFKIILPNLNTMPEPARQMQVNPEKCTLEEKVIALTKQRGVLQEKK